MADFYVENQASGLNPHDRIKPIESARILIAHVMDGKRLAHLHRLGTRLTDIIQQHHGTSLITYFFQKAKEDPANEQVRMSDFRYPGPIPKIGEAAIAHVS